MLFKQWVDGIYLELYKDGRLYLDKGEHDDFISLNPEQTIALYELIGRTYWGSSPTAEARDLKSLQ